MTHPPTLCACGCGTVFVQAWRGVQRKRYASRACWVRAQKGQQRNLSGPCRPETAARIVALLVLDPGSARPVEHEGEPNSAGALKADGAALAGELRRRARLKALAN